MCTNGVWWLIYIYIYYYINNDGGLLCIGYVLWGKKKLESEIIEFINKMK